MIINKLQRTKIFQYFSRTTSATQIKFSTKRRKKKVRNLLNNRFNKFPNFFFLSWRKVINNCIDYTFASTSVESYNFQKLSIRSNFRSIRSVLHFSMSLLDLIIIYDFGQSDEFINSFPSLWQFLNYVLFFLSNDLYSSDSFYSLIYYLYNSAV